MRAEYIADMSAFHPDMLVFIDETGSERRNSMRQYGYGLHGITPVQYQLIVYGKRISGIGISTTEGIEDVYIVEGNINGTIFLQFIQVFTRHYPTL